MRNRQTCFWSIIGSVNFSFTFTFIQRAPERRWMDVLDAPDYRRPCVVICSEVCSLQNPFVASTSCCESRPKSKAIRPCICIPNPRLTWLGGLHYQPKQRDGNGLPLCFSLWSLKITAKPLKSTYLKKVLTNIDNKFLRIFHRLYLAVRFRMGKLALGCRNHGKCIRKAVSLWNHSAPRIAKEACLGYYAIRPLTFLWPGSSAT